MPAQPRSGLALRPLVSVEEEELPLFDFFDLVRELDTEVCVLRLRFCPIRFFALALRGPGKEGLVAWMMAIICACWSAESPSQVDLWSAIAAQGLPSLSGR